MIATQEPSGRYARGPGFADPFDDIADYARERLGLPREPWWVRERRRQIAQDSEHLQAFLARVLWRGPILPARASRPRAVLRAPPSRRPHWRSPRHRVALGSRRHRQPVCR